MTVEGIAGHRAERWERASVRLVLPASSLYLIAYSWLILDPLAPRPLRIVLATALTTIWALFIIDVGVRLLLTPRGRRLTFVRTHTVITLSAILPVVRPFELLRYLWRLPGLRGHTRATFRFRVITTVLAYEVMFVYVIALAVLAVERNAAHATIVNFGDALWWTCVTITTVGYGDFAPITALGRVLAVILMAGGVFILGTATATIVSYFNDRVAAFASADRGPGPGTDATA